MGVRTNAPRKLVHRTRMRGNASTPAGDVVGSAEPRNVIVSWNELQRTCQKAFRGLGVPAGADDDASFAVLWLQARGLDALTPLDGSAFGPGAHSPRVRSSSGSAVPHGWRRRARRRRSVRGVGRERCDRLCRCAGGRERGPCRRPAHRSRRRDPRCRRPGATAGVRTMQPSGVAGRRGASQARPGFRRRVPSVPGVARPRAIAPRTRASVGPDRGRRTGWESVDDLRAMLAHRSRRSGTRSPCHPIRGSGNRGTRRAVDAPSCLRQTDPGARDPRVPRAGGGWGRVQRLSGSWTA